MVVPPEAAVAVAAVRAGARARDLESDRLEFKTDTTRSAADSIKLLAEAAACLANAQGGHVVVGVSDRTPGPTAFVGTSLSVEAVRQGVFEQTSPGLVVGVEIVPEGAAQLLVITVPVSPTVHAVSGRCTERVGATCQPMSTERIATVISDRRGDDWSAQDSGIPLAHVDQVAIAQARTLLERVPDPARRAYARQPDADLLRSLGVVSERQTLTSAGALLLTSSDNEQLAYVFRRTPTGALAFNEHLTGPLLPALQRVLDLVDARLERTSVNVGGGQQLQLPDLPEVAVREALVNAVMHRDYRRTGPVVADHSPTRFAVTSPGPFLTGITPQNVLTTSSRTRNPQLAAAIRTLGLAEQAGTGVDRMYAEMARIGHQPPDYTTGPDHVQVALLGGAPNTYLARFTASLPPDEAADADTMLTLLTLLQRRTINASAAAPLMQRSEQEAQGVLERLAADPVSILEPTRETSHRSRPNYRLRGPILADLGPAVTYHRRTPDEYDRKLVGLVQESGQINGRTVQLVLDLDRTAASRVLADLVARGLLVKTSAAQRGPGVTYGPGPQFPAQKRPSRKKGRATPPHAPRPPIEPDPEP